MYLFRNPKHVTSKTSGLFIKLSPRLPVVRFATLVRSVGGDVWSICGEPPRLRPSKDSGRRSLLRGFAVRISRHRQSVHRIPRRGLSAIGQMRQSSSCPLLPISGATVRFGETEERQSLEHVSHDRTLPRRSLESIDPLCSASDRPRSGVRAPALPSQGGLPK
jgi:hypothetical protein